MLDMNCKLFVKANLILKVGFCCIIMATSCERKKIIDPLGEVEHRVVFDFIETINLPLDDSTDTNPFFYQIIEENGLDLLLYFNYYDYSIRKVSLIKAETIDKIKLALDGANGVSNIALFHYHNSDSIFVIDRFKKLVLMSDRGVIYQRYNVGLDETNTTYTADISNNFMQQTILKDDKFYYTNGNFKMSFNKPFLEKVDLLRDTVLVTGYFPKYYSIEYFDNREAFNVATAYNTNKNEFVYGFHISSDLMIRNMEDQFEFKSTGLKNLCIDCHKSPFKLTQGVTLPPEQYRVIDEQFVKNYVYLDLKYDRINDVYIRVLKMPTSDFDFENTPAPMKFNQADYIIMVLDAVTFQYLGHMKLDGKIYDLRLGGNFLFMANGSLYVKRKPVTSEDDNKMIFDNFSIIK
jgi:hypothetical protein